MKLVRQRIKPVGIFMAIFMLLISGVFQSALAAMIETETVLIECRGNEARAYLNHLLAREDVQNALINQGIDPLEAKYRIDSLTDSEAAQIADKLDQLPSGGDFFVTLLIVSFIVFLILLITDIAGYTDIFPFVKAQK